MFFSYSFSFFFVTNGNGLKVRKDTDTPQQGLEQDITVDEPTAFNEDL